MTTTATKEHPIIMTGESVRAILDVRKTQTRRVVNPQPVEFCDEGGSTVISTGYSFTSGGSWWLCKRCPFGVPGSILWVRETFSPCVCDQCVEYWPKQPPPDPIGMIHTPLYEATYKGPSGTIWKSSRYLPRWACRLLLEVTAIRVERVQEISYYDMRAEGIKLDPFQTCDSGRAVMLHKDFHKLWDSINAKRKGGIYAWDKNPWVFVIDFKRVEV